jgi:hypothetical protein
MAYKWTAKDFESKTVTPSLKGLNYEEKKPEYSRLYTYEDLGIQNPSLPSIKPMEPSRGLGNIIGKPAWEQYKETHTETPNLIKPLGFALETFNRIPVTQRLMSNAANALSGGNAYLVDAQGNKQAPADTGSKILNTATDVGGQLLGMGLAGPGGGTNLLNATDDISKLAGDKVANLLGKKAIGGLERGGSTVIGNQLAGALTRGAVDAGAGTVIQNLSEGRIKDLPKDLAVNMTGGAALFGAGKLAGEGINYLKSLEPKLPKIEQPLNAKIEPTASRMETPNTNIPVNKTTPTIANITQDYISKLDNVDDINNTLKQIEEQIKNAPDEKSKLLAMDLQRFAQKKLDELQSKFRSNTIERAKAFTDEEKKLIDPKEFDYVPQKSADWAEQAERAVTENMQKVMDDIKNKSSLSGGQDAHEAALVAIKLRNEARRTGNYNPLIDWLKTVAGKTRETARALKGTDTAWDKKTVDGALMDAARTVDNVEDGLKNTNPKILDKVDNETKQIKDILENAKKEAAKELEKLSPEQLLARKVSSTLPTDKVKEKDVVQDMVNELFRVAKESPLPTKAKIPPRNPIDFLKQAINDKANYGSVWNKAKSIVESKYLDDPRAQELLNNYFNKGIIPTYSQKTVENSVKTTLKDLGKTLDEIARSSKGDKVQALQELSDYITKATGATGEDAALLAQNIQTKYDQLVKDKSESILQNMFKERPAKGQKSQLERIMDLVNLGAYDDNALRDIIKQKEGLPVLTPDDVDFITTHMENSKTLPEGSYEQRVEIAKVRQLIADKIPSSGSEKMQAAQRILMLSNPKTAIVRNPLGNVLLNTLESVKNIPGAGIDKAVSAIRGSERTTILDPLTKGKAALSGASKGLKEWALDIKNGVDTSNVGAGVELPSKVKIFNENTSNPVMKTVNKAANKVHYLVGNALKLGDTPFYNAAYSERLAELKKIKKTDIISDVMKEDAKVYALERTLQNDSFFAALFSNFKNPSSLNKHPEGKAVYQTIMNLIIPFTKTPANILDKFIDYSPAGALKGSFKGLSQSRKGVFNQKNFVDTMARSLTGTGLMTLGYLMAEKGLITGDRNKSNKVANIETALGKQNYAFKVGDTYYSYDWALPASAPIAMGADIYNAIKGSKEGQNPVLTGIESAGNLLFNSTVLQGPSKLLGGYSPAASIGETLLGATTQATPTAGKQISQVLDPYVRDTYDPNPFKKTLNKTLARLPGVSKTLPKRVDIFGNDVKAYQGKNSFYNVFLNPGFTTTYKPDKAQAEIVRLYQESGETKQLPGIADKIIPKTKTNPTVTLSGEELNQYQRLIGQNTLKSVNTIIDSPSYNKYNDEQKAEVIRKAVELAKTQAKLEILKNKGITK